MNGHEKSAIEARMQKAIKNVHESGTKEASDTDLMLSGFSLLIEELRETRQTVCEVRREEGSKVIKVAIPVVVIAAIAGGITQPVLNAIIQWVGS